MSDFSRPGEASGNVGRTLAPYIVGGVKILAPHLVRMVYILVASAIIGEFEIAFTRSSQNLYSDFNQNEDFFY
jgi:hypothetical protein